MKKVTEYLFGTVLPCFVKKWQKKYATLVIAYLKRSFEEKSFHFFYWSDMIIQDNSYNKVFKNFVLSLWDGDAWVVLFIIIFCFSMWITGWNAWTATTICSTKIFIFLIIFIYFFKDYKHNYSCNCSNNDCFYHVLTSFQDCMINNKFYLEKLF